MARERLLLAKASRGDCRTAITNILDGAKSKKLQLASTALDGLEDTCKVTAELTLQEDDERDCSYTICSFGGKKKTLYRLVCCLWERPGGTIWTSS